MDSDRHIPPECSQPCVAILLGIHRSTIERMRRGEFKHVRDELREFSRHCAHYFGAGAVGAKLKNDDKRD